MTRRRTLPTTLTGAAAVALAAVAVAGCGSSGGGNAATSNAAKTGNAPATTVGLASTGLGKVLVDAQGRTLYRFSADHGAMSACTGACVTDWPPLRRSGKPTAGTGVQAAAVTTSKRADGGAQIVYHGHPLYTFAGDHKPGDTAGQALNEFGGLWYAVTAAGAQASGGGGGNGY
jgi:predicted lipoprotein with Yx(FWY)xxD motif